MWKHFEESFIIPKSFKALGGKTFNIKTFDTLKGLYGDFNDVKSLIRLAKTIDINDETCDISKEDMIRTYLHELGHCFQYQYDGNCDETFANSFSNFFYEYLSTKEE